MSLFIFLLRLWPVLVASRLAPVAAHPQDRKLPSAGTTTTSVSSVNTAAPSQQQCEDDPKWSLTKDNWINGNTDDFVKQILSKAGPATSPNPENTVPKYLVEHYTAGVTSYICNPQHACRLESCHSMRQQQPDAIAAYRTLAAISNLNDYHVMLLNAIQHAQFQLLFFLNGFVQTFSSQSKAAEFEPIITQVVVTAVAMSIAFLIPLLPLGEAGTKMGAIPGYGSAFISIYLQTRERSGATLSGLSSIFGFFSDATRTLLYKDNSALLSGGTDSGGLTLDAYLKNGALAEIPVDRTLSISQFVNNQIAATAVNAVWSSDHVYIVASPLQTDVPCKKDVRGPQATKFCKDGDPHVYYAYSILDASGISAFPWQSVRTPTGFDKLAAFGQKLDIATVLEQSIAAFYHNPTLNPKMEEQIAGLKRTSLLQGLNFTDTLRDSYGQELPILPLTYRIPVCYDYTGAQQVPDDHIWSDVKSIPQYFATDPKFGAKFPCRCGPLARDSENFKQRTGLSAVTKYTTWCVLNRYEIVENGEPDHLDVPAVWQERLKQLGLSLSQIPRTI